MGKLAGGLAMAAAILGSLAIWVLRGEILILIPLLAIASAILLLVDRRAMAVVMALVLIVGGLLTIPAALNDWVIGNSDPGAQGTGLNLFGAYSQAALVAVALLTVMAFLVVEMERLEPKWALYVALGASVVALVWTFFIDTQLTGSISSPAATLPPGIIALGAVLAGVHLWALPPPRPRNA